MRFDRDRLIFLALVVLDEACDETKKGQVRPSFSIRLALATLYAMGRGDRGKYHEFWREMRDPRDNANGWKQANTMRHNYTRRCLDGIARDVGVALSTDYSDRIAKVRMGRARKSR